MARTPKKTARKARKTKSPKKEQKKQSTKATTKKAKAAKKRKVVKKGSNRVTAAYPRGAIVPASFRVDEAASEDEILDSAFEKMIARGNQLKKSLVCYSQLSDGTWEVCLLQSDGSYGQCKRYDGPVHEPICGG
jgi:cell division protein YceG involved in septum cleavage